MPELKSTAETQRAWPDDLRDWFDEKTLVRFTLRTLRPVELGPSAYRIDGGFAPGKPRILLNVLVYSYAIGLLPSEEIETNIPVDPQLLSVSGGVPICANELRHFRRHHRLLLHQSLCGLLQLALASRRRSVVDDTGTEFATERSVSLAAEDRVNRAVLMDSMALDL